MSSLEKEIWQKARGGGYGVASQCAVKAHSSMAATMHRRCGPRPRPWPASLTRAHLRTWTASRIHSPTATIMAAMYKPSEAIALFRPSFVLPRIKPSTRRTPIGRFSTTRHAQALSSPPNAPIPPPQRKSITLTGDTGQVRWSDLSPGEKVVRTTQQSLNLTVVIVGVVATVCLDADP